MTDPYGFRCAARAVIVQALIDYAKADKTQRDPRSSQSGLSRAAEVMSEVRGFFSSGYEDFWLDKSDFDVTWLLEEFERIAKDPNRLSVIANLRYVD